MTKQLAIVSLNGTNAMHRAISLMEFCGRPVANVACVLATQKALVWKTMIASINIGAVVKINAAVHTDLDGATVAP